jgi:mannose/cellobiose epimerase-like protein (N-acyl-D-glucosamine 2-epimerase family)
LDRAIPGRLAEAGGVLQRVLEDNVAAFWRAAVVDPETPGYRLNHDANGQWLGPADCFLVAQARTLWFFSRLIRSGRARPGDEEIAARGFRFLAGRMWDRTHGGFYWGMDPKTSRVTWPGKHLYGHAFALFAVAEHALATGSARAADLARRIFAVVEERFHDPEHPGYHEVLGPSWEAPEAGRPHYLGSPCGEKLINSHLHMLEALGAYLELADEPLVRTRLAEVRDIIAGPALRRPLLSLADRHQPDWTPVSPPEEERVSYGHDLECIHLLVGTDAALGRPEAADLELWRSLFDAAMRHGEDREQGGMFAGGPPAAEANERRKVYWVQAEAMLAALTLHRLTGEDEYAAAFLRTLHWVADRQVDWQHGEWHSRIEPDGSAAGQKASRWKGPYHTGRFLLESLELLPAWVDPDAPII